MENKKRTRGLTDEQVEQEIERLRHSDAVRLAKKKERYDYRRRQYLYTLRFLEKRGIEMMASGLTEEELDRMYRRFDAEEESEDIYDD